MTIYAITLDPDTFAEDRRVRVLMRAPLIVGCTSCHVQRGDDCHSSHGFRAPFHPARWRAIKHLDDDQREAMVKELQAERLAARTAPIEALTPQQSATRAATSAAWDSINRSDVA